MSISPENEQFIQEAIHAGTFHDRDEVLNEAISLLKSRQSLIAHIDEGIQQLAGGQYIEYDETSLQARFDRLQERAAKRAEGNRRQA